MVVEEDKCKCSFAKIHVSVVDVGRTKVVGAVVNLTLGGNPVSQRETRVLLIMREKQ